MLEIFIACKAVEIMMAAAWQNRQGIKRRSKISQGISADFCGKTEMEPRLKEARLEARRWKLEKKLDRKY